MSRAVRSLEHLLRLYCLRGDLFDSPRENQTMLSSPKAPTGEGNPQLNLITHAESTSSAESELSSDGFRRDEPRNGG